MSEQKTTQSFRDTVKVSRYILKLIAAEKGGKAYLTVTSLQAMFDALFPLVFTVFPGLIINELMGEQRINTIILLVAVISLTPVVRQGINFLVHRYKARAWQMTRMEIEANIHRNAITMDYENFENPSFRVTRKRIWEVYWDLSNTMGQLTGLLAGIIGVIAVSALIFTLNPLLIALVLVIIFINSLYTKLANKRKYILGKELSKAYNYRWARTWPMEEDDYQKEIRLFNLKSFLLGNWLDAQKKTIDLDVKWNVIGMTVNNFNAVTGFIQQALIYAYLIFRVISGAMTVGVMTIFLAAVSQFSGALTQLSNNYLALSGSNMKIGEFIEFFNMPKKQMETGDKTPAFGRNSTIEFRNVSFKYPGSEVYALQNLNLTFRGDEKLCIVGANGAGKSTFIKLLTRLYYPTDGDILLDGVSIYEYDYTQYQQMFATSFQDSSYFNSYTIAQNIVLSCEFDKEKLERVGEQAGLKPLVTKHPKGYDTMLGKWLEDDGAELSGGEVQRLAIARAVYQDAPVYLLDEPTAALDPVAEYEIYTQFNNMITDRAAILITHRLSAVKLADKVAVFDAGAVVEYGTHDQLYKNSGIYAEMYDKQAEFYK